jgi:hypothetical protein
MKKSIIALAALFAATVPAAAQTCDSGGARLMTPDQLLQPMGERPFTVLVMLQNGSSLFDKISTAMPHDYGHIVNQELGAGSAMVFDENSGRRLSDKTDFADFPVIILHACLRPGADMFTAIKDMAGKNGIEAIAPDSLMQVQPRPVTPQP